MRRILVQIKFQPKLLVLLYIIASYIVKGQSDLLKFASPCIITEFQ